MTTLFINAIVGTGTYADPDDDTKAAAIATDLQIALAGVSNFAYNNLTAAWVRTTDAGGGRTINAQVDGVTYTGKECLSDAEVQTMGTAVKNAILGRSGVTSVGTISVDLWLFNAPGRVVNANMLQSQPVADVGIPTDNYVLTWDSVSGEWAPEEADGNATALQSQPVLDVGVPTTNHVLTWDGSYWTPAAPAAGGLAEGDVLDLMYALG